MLESGLRLFARCVSGLRLWAMFVTGLGPWDLGAGGLVVVLDGSAERRGEDVDERGATQLYGELFGGFDESVAYHQDREGLGFDSDREVDGAVREAATLEIGCGSWIESASDDLEGEAFKRGGAGSRHGEGEAACAGIPFEQGDGSSGHVVVGIVIDELPCGESGGQVDMG